jgi:hypothetical protein
MKLTKKDKEILREIGYLDEDMEQIERATTKTTYELDDKKVYLKEVLKILSREDYLNGIGRSAFHRTTSKTNNGKTIYFNSSKLFGEKD